MTSKIGFVGLGIMGKPMAKNLLKASHSLVVYDIMPAGMDEVVAAVASTLDVELWLRLRDGRWAADPQSTCTTDVAMA